MGTAQTRAVARYIKKTYDAVTFRVKKGKKSELQNIAKSLDKSLNQFIIDAIDFYIASIK